MIDVAVDYLAFSQNGTQLRLQCKSRSKTDATVFDLSLAKGKRTKLPTHVFYLRGPANRAEYWIVPFSVVKKITTKMTGRTGRTVYRLYLTKDSLQKLRDFRNEYGVEEVKRWQE